MLGGSGGGVASASGRPLLLRPLFLLQLTEYLAFPSPKLPPPPLPK
uniref:Dof zinc finger protein DOF5.4 n=1 Tax=Rhizophora mucronata TaxID=61149 RepID=A0A2P2K3Y9_RHIMU